MKVTLFKHDLRPAPLILLASLWLLLFHNHAFFGALVSDYPLGEGYMGFVIFVAIFLGAFIAFELALLSLVIPVRWGVSAVLLSAAATAFFMSNYGTVFDSIMIRNLVETNTTEAQDLLSWGLFQTIFLTAILPILAIWKMPWAADPYLKRLRSCSIILALSFLTMIACIAMYSANFTSFAREHRDMHVLANPIYPIYSLVRYAQEVTPSWRDEGFHHLSTYATITEDHEKPKLVILVVGETARADHFSLNGYPRVTNPLLQQRQELISFPHVASCGTSTSISLPCMFDYHGRDDFSVVQSANEENILDTLATAGVSVLWRDDNTGSKGIADRVDFEDFTAPDMNTVCDTECRDVGMIEGLQDYIALHPGSILFILHQLGSHGPAYYLRYPKTFEVFTPACQTNELSACDKASLVNVYDNTILYTDYFLNEVINFLEKNQERFETSMIYLGDHGESLGEFGVYLHGLPYMFAPEAQTNVPLIIWGGNSTTIDMAASEASKNEPYSHDQLVNTLLALFKVETDAYDPSIQTLIKTVD